jgi:hypothetical protein
MLINNSLHTSPGPVEAKLLAEHLDVSASYILGLTTNPSGELPSKIASVPLIPLEDAHTFIKEQYTLDKNHECIVFQSERSHQLLDTKNIIATQLLDNSMEPDFYKNDILIVDCKKKPTPASYVLVLLDGKNKTVFRQYSENDEPKALYQLLASNQLWPITVVKKKQRLKL